MSIIDYTDSNQVMKISQEIVEKARLYQAARRKSAIAKWKLDLILASKMEEMRLIRKSIGYDTARVMLLEYDDEEIAEYYREEERWTSEYKGLEKVIDALQSQVSLCQSLIKNKVREA